MPAPAPVRPLVADAALLIACIGAAVAVSLGLRQDANWDLQNYHFYNPWAWWHGRIFGRDIAAAQLQTYHNALADLPFYAMVAADWPPRAIAAMLALPAGVAAFFYGKLVALLFGDLPAPDRRVATGCAFAIGITPAIGIGVIGTTMNEWPLVALLMPALWLVVRGLVRGGGGALAQRTLGGAGFLCGLASGLKLTAATFAVGLCVALLLRGPHDRAALRRAIGEAFVFGVAVLAGTALTLGPWAWELWTHFANPVFPYGNELFRSPWWGDYPVLIRQYGPHDVVQWLRFPFNLIGPGAGFVTEVFYRDARMPLTYALAIFAGAAWLSLRARGRDALPVPADRGVSRAWQVVTVFFIVSFVLWTAQHSVYRYVIVLDMLCGALIVTLLYRLLRPGLVAGVVVVIAVALVASTRPADWWRVDFGARWLDVQVPAVEKDAMVLITTDAPVAYALPFFPPDARHVGIANSVSAPSRETRLQETVAAAVRGHAGPLYQLTSPPGSGTAALAAYGLARDPASCAPLTSNITKRPVELCRVVRGAAPHPVD